MQKRIIAWALALCAVQCVVAEPLKLAAHPPHQYTVQSQDTVWDIAAKYLQHPWQWQAFWQSASRDSEEAQLFPGDVLAVKLIDEQPQLHRVERGTVTLSPKVRVSDSEKAIAAIPVDAVRPFMTDTWVIADHDWQDSPYIISHGGQHLVTALGDRIYVRGLKDEKQRYYNIFRRGTPYFDSKSHALLGYEAVHVGKAKLQQSGEVAVMSLVETRMEVLIGDRLTPVHEQSKAAHFFPKAPSQSVHGNIISVLGTSSQISRYIARYSAVVLDRGENVGLQPGDVMAIRQQGRLIRDPVTKDRKDTTVAVPNELVGELMVFRTFPKVSFALVMNVTQPVYLLDEVVSP